jgi:hypothetical protein
MNATYDLTQLQSLLLESVGPKGRRVMKRCFMTGKQCIFLSQVADAATKPLNLETMTAFVMMPFGPNLETFYRWSLKPFLTNGYGIPERNIRRADEVRNIGYIICEKICHRIQDSDFVLADISFNNENVFYEVGLAYGLERPVIFMRNAKDHDSTFNDPVVRQSLALGEQKLLEYPGVGVLDRDNQEYHLHRFVKRPPSPQPSGKRLNIALLTVGREGDSPRSSTRRDIRLSLDEVLNGAIGVAMSEIRQENAQSNEPWAKVIGKIDSEEWKKFKSPERVEVDGKSSFEEIAKKLESSFCTVIDVSNSDPVAYFWLGYCHARGLNGIPVFRSKTKEKDLRVPTPDVPSKVEAGGNGPPKGSDLYASQENEQTEAALAFDIRALWYAEFEEEQPYRFKDKMKEILEHLLERDLPNRQKRAFWDRFPAERKLRVLTGTIHNPQLNREMVGDWDVRAVSELLSCLPSVKEAMAIELALPLYSPEEAFKRSGGTHGDQKRDVKKLRRDFIADFRNGIGNQLRDCNAIVIASPDVNPITEFVLHKIYQVSAPKEPFDECLRPDFNGHVVVKRLHKNLQEEIGSPKEAVDEEMPIRFPRLFYTEKENESEKPDRGFLVHARTTEIIEQDLLQPYLSQDECRVPFDLLGHLVVARYPIESERGASLIVLLNGVSGPATFGLAQLLTGGGGHAGGDMNSQSEMMLQKLNEVLDTPGCIGVEAIVKVHIVPATLTSTSDGEAIPQETNLDPTYRDSRRVQSWEFIGTPKPIMRRTP